MISIPYEQILAKIKEGSDISETELQSKIKAKLDQLSGLISKEGAAHIIANELGVKLFDAPKGGFKIKDILTGMRDLEIAGKITQLYDVKEFDKNGRKGKIGSCMIGDESGQLRIVLWNDQADQIANLKTGDIIKVKSAYVRENNNKKEVHLGERSTLIKNPEGITIGEVKETTQASAPRRKLQDLKEPADNIEIMGTIVQIFNPAFFEVCPECSKRTKGQDGVFNCGQHGNITPAFSYVMNAIIDDGTDTVRAVFFRNQAERLTKKSPEEFLKYKDSPDAFEAVKTDLLGEQVKLIGRAVKNDMFERIEFISQLVFEANPEEEIEKLKNS